MSGNRVDNRDRYRRKDSGRGDDERRYKNRSRQDDRYRNDKRDRSPKRRERTRSRSPKYNKNYDDNDNRQQTRQNHHQQHHHHKQQQQQQYNRNDNNERKYNNKNNNNYSRKFDFDNKNINNNEKSPEWGKKNIKNENNEKKDKDLPNFGLSGKLTEDTNTVNGIVIKYSEPQDARKPKRRWRLYPFKGEKSLPVLYVHRQSAFLMGRDRKIADIPLDHPSCSKQHAALQYRLVSYKRDNGGEGKRIRPYIIDLESANGTYVNKVKLEPRRYHELLEKDVIKFGFSSREYVLLHEHSKDDELDDDVITTTSETITKTEETP